MKSAATSISKTISKAIVKNIDTVIPAQSLVERTFYIDIGRDITGPGYKPGELYPTDDTWNQLAVGDGVVPITGTTTGLLLDKVGDSSDFYAEVTANFDSMNFQGGASNNPTEPTMIYPWEAIRDQFYIDLGNTGIITLKGLDNSRKYMVKCLPSKSWSTYLTRFTIQGSSVDLDAKDNVAVTADFDNLSPIGGEISIEVMTPSSSKGTINVIELIEKA